MNIYEIEFEYFDNLNLSQKDWENLLRNYHVFDEDALLIVQMFYQFENHFATIKDVAYMLGMTEWFVKNTINILGQKLRKELNFPLIKYSSKELNYIYMFIKYPDFTFELRRNLVLALKKLYPYLTIRFKHINNKIPIILSNRIENTHFLDIFKKKLYENYNIEEIEEKYNKPVTNVVDRSERIRYPLLRKYNFDLNIERILENYVDLSDYQIQWYTGKSYKTEYLRVFGIMDKKNNIIKKVYFNSGLNIMFHKFGINKEHLRISLVQGYEKFKFKEYLPDLWYEVLNHLNFIPNGFETFEDKQMSEDIFLYKTYDLEQIDEETLARDINNIIVTYIHILPIYKEILKRLEYNIKRGNEIKFTKKTDIIPQKDIHLKIRSEPVEKNYVENITKDNSHEIEAKKLKENEYGKNITEMQLDNIIKYFNYEKFMNSTDYISLNDFSKKDQEDIIKYNGCGNIVFHVKTKTEEFDEIWLFNNEEDQINPLKKNIYEIKPHEISKTKNLELFSNDEIESINVNFDYFDAEKIKKIIKENKKVAAKGDIEYTNYREITLNDFDDESKMLFKRYRGHGTISRTIVTRIGSNIVEKYSFDDVLGYIPFNEITDNTILGIHQENDNELKDDLIPNQNILRYQYSFEPFKKRDYDNLKRPLAIDFNYEGYMKNVNELINSSCFSDDEIESMFENNKQGLVYYCIQTSDNEIIRDCYRISKIYEHKENSMDYSHDDEAIDYDSDTSYMIRLLPYKLREKNNFTIPRFDIIGNGHWFYEDFLDFVQLSDFNSNDQEIIKNCNGCGCINIEIKTYDNRSFLEKWVFNDEISDDITKSIGIVPLELDEDIDSLSLTYNDIKEIKYKFEEYTKEMINSILDENEKKIIEGKEILSKSDEIIFEDFDDESKHLFKKYFGKGEIIRTTITKSGKYFEEIWELDNIDREVFISNIEDESKINIYSENLDNRLNSEFYPLQDFFRMKHSFKPYSDEKYEELALCEEFDYDDYIEKGSEFIECYEFTEDDRNDIDKYRDNGLVYYEFKTVTDEIIRDFYEIKYMVKHDVEKELLELKQEIDISLLSENELEEIKQYYNHYDLSVVPYKIDERNHFTVPEIEKVGSGNWYYKKLED